MSRNGSASRARGPRGNHPCEHQASGSGGGTGRGHPPERTTDAGRTKNKFIHVSKKLNKNNNYIANACQDKPDQSGRSRISVLESSSSNDGGLGQIISVTYWGIQGKNELREEMRTGSVDRVGLVSFGTVPDNP